ncbi:MAG: YdgA family protein [Chromatiaceae bacterium]
MRRVLPVVALLALVALGLPWWLGGEAERLYDRALAQLSAQGLRVLDSHYERGWFASRATAKLVLRPRSPRTTGRQELAVRVESLIQHGPWSLKAPRMLPAAAFIESRVSFGPKAAESPSVDLDTIVDVDGGGVTRLHVPARKPSGTQEPAQITLAQGTGELRFSPDLASGQGWLELPAVQLTADGETVRVRNLRIQSSGSRGVGGFLTGTGHLTVGEVDAEGLGGNLRASGISMAGESRPDGDLLNLHAEYRVTDLVINGARYAPSVLALSIRRLAGPALASLQQALDALSENGVEPSTAGITAAAIFASHLPALLTADPGIALERLEISTPDGPVSGKLSVAVNGLTPQALRRRGAWLQHLVGEGELDLPEPLLVRLMTDWRRRQVLAELRKQDEQVATVPTEYEARIAAAAAEQLAGLVRQGWVTQERGRITTGVKLADALLTINGKTLPLGVPDVP